MRQAGHWVLRIQQKTAIPGAHQAIVLKLRTVNASAEIEDVSIIVSACSTAVGRDEPGDGILRNIKFWYVFIATFSCVG
jgi:hypothetical protein